MDMCINITSTVAIAVSMLGCVSLIACVGMVTVILIEALRS